MIMREGKRNRETDTVQKQTRKVMKREYDYVKEIAMEFREKHTHEHTHTEKESQDESQREGIR